MEMPPDNLPIYRLLTGVDDASFCNKVSFALSQGYKLYGSPSASFNGKNTIVAQAVIWPCAQTKMASANTGVTQTRAEFSESSSDSGEPHHSA